MTRIIAGAAGGRRITAPPGRSTRPMSDRTKEGLFATVGSLLGSLDGTRVINLYAGSGAVGLEALSRGAGHALFIEHDPKAVRVIRSNIAGLGLGGAEVRTERVDRALAHGPPAEPYDAAFADPPYPDSNESVTAMLRALYDHRWLVGDALVVVDRATRTGAFTWPVGLEEVKARRYGDTTLWYGRVAGPA